MLPRAAADNRVVLETARLVFAAAIDKNTPLTVAGLALAAGITEDAVVEVLNSPQYLEAMTREFRTMAGLHLRRGVEKMADFVESHHARDAVPAYRALLETYKTFATVADPQDQEAREAEFARRLAALRQLKQPKEP